MSKRNELSDWPKIRAEKTRVNPETGCVEWLAGLSKKGYGKVRMNRLWASVHRVAFMAEAGEIPAGMHVLHKCDNRKCCNVHHLFLGTNESNISDKVEKCRAGKALDKEAVSNIKAMLRCGVTQKEIAALHGVAPSSISRIASGYRWSQVS